VVDELVGQTEAQHPRAVREAVDHARDFGAGAADHGVFLDDHQQFVRRGKLGDQGLVERLDEAHVGDGGVERITDFAGDRHEAAEGEQGDTLAAAQDLALANG